jgi:hypothetical protein
MATRLIAVAETRLFVRQAEKIWSREEHDEFVDFIAANPDTGDIIPETGGVRKVRWARRGPASVAAYVSSTSLSIAIARSVRQLALTLKRR